MTYRPGTKHFDSSAEHRWWVRLWARVETKEHLGGPVRQTLMDLLRAPGREWWAFDPFVRLGLFLQAWAIQRTLSLRPWEPLPLVADCAAATEYAIGILSKSPHWHPSTVRSHHRETALEILGVRAKLDRRSRDVLLGIARDSTNPDRARAAAALRLAADNGDDEALLTLVGAASSRGTRYRREAIGALGWLAGGGFSMALDGLVAVARDRNDPKRWDAIVELGEAAVDGADAALLALRAVADDPDDPLSVYALDVWDKVTDLPRASKFSRRTNLSAGLT